MVAREETEADLFVEPGPTQGNALSTPPAVPKGHSNKGVQDRTLPYYAVGHLA